MFICLLTRKVIRAAWHALLLIILLLGLVSTVRAFYPIKFREPVDRSSREFNLDPLLLYAVIRVESRFDPRAISPAGARGLMQIMPRTGSWAASRLGMTLPDPALPDRLMDPETNIRIGAFYLRYLFDQFDGDPATALAAYNAGLKNVAEWLEVSGKPRLDVEDIRFAETRRFIEMVTRDKKVYRLFYPRYPRYLRTNDRSD